MTEFVHRQRQRIRELAIGIECFLLEEHADAVRRLDEVAAVLMLRSLGREDRTGRFGSMFEHELIRNRAQGCAFDTAFEVLDDQHAIALESRDSIGREMTGREC